MDSSAGEKVSPQDCQRSKCHFISRRMNQFKIKFFIFSQLRNFEATMLVQPKSIQKVLGRSGDISRYPLTLSGNSRRQLTILVILVILHGCRRWMEFGLDTRRVVHCTEKPPWSIIGDDLYRRRFLVSPSVLARYTNLGMRGRLWLRPVIV